MTAVACAIPEAVKDFAGDKEDCGSANGKVIPAQLLTQASYCDSDDSRSGGDESEDSTKNNKSSALVDVAAGGEQRLRWLRHEIILR